MMKNAIEVAGLTKRYLGNGRHAKPTLALDQVDFTVQAGEVFGYLGPNGAGKTTTVNILTTLIPPTQGAVRVAGYDVIDERFAVRSKIGVVPEISNVYDEYSAWDNLIFTAQLYGIPKLERENRAEELLRAFGLWQKRDALASGFSKGMRRRLCLMMGLMHRPEVLFLDEPTSGLDMQSVLVIREMIQRLRDDGATIFLTTHNIEEANLLSDRVAIIRQGKIAAIDSPTELKRTFQERLSLEVSFGQKQPRLSDLNQLTEVTEVKRVGEKWRLYTGSPEAAIPSIVDWSRANRMPLTSLNMVEPTLEEVFLYITGLTIQD